MKYDTRALIAAVRELEAETQGHVERCRCAACKRLRWWRLELAKIPEEIVQLTGGQS